MRKLSLAGTLVCIFVLAAQLTAQQRPTDSSIRAAAINKTVKRYQDYVSFAAPLYSGPQYDDYYLIIQTGQPFYLNTDFHHGSIVYDNMLYEKIPMKYDMVQNSIVIQDASGIFRIIPENNRISSFSIGDHQFIKLVKDSSHLSLPKTGFYEVLYSGSHLTLLKKETKEVIDDMTNSRDVMQRYVLSKIDFYVKRGNTYSLLTKKKHVLPLFKDKKTEMRQYMRKENLDFNADAEKAAISIVSYYESLVK